jgi:hypothetical protein
VTVRRWGSGDSRGRRARWLPLLLGLGLAAVGGCGLPEFQSHPLDEAVVIDGDAGEWRGSVYFLDGERTVIGIRNDAENLYLCLSSSDPNIERQVLGRGLTVWFDPAGGEAKTFGLRFPLGMKARSGADVPEGERPADPPGDKGPEQPPASPGGGPARRGRPQDPFRSLARAIPADSTAELEIIRADGTTERMRVASTTGLGVKAGLRESVLTYELRIPRVADAAHPLGIALDSARPFGLGLETPKYKRGPGEGSLMEEMPDGWTGGRADDTPDLPGESPDQGPDGSQPPEGRGGASGGRGGRPGQDGGVSRPSVGPIRYWLLVRLDGGA